MNEEIIKKGKETKEAELDEEELDAVDGGVVSPVRTGESTFLKETIEKSLEKALKNRNA